MSHEDAAREVARLFLGAGRAKRPRAKPHRCFDCGRVTKHVRCPECGKRRWEEKRNEAR